MVAQNSHEAIRQIEEHPDLILLDINMPEMDGLELCRKIRNFNSKEEPRCSSSLTS